MSKIEYAMVCGYVVIAIAWCLYFIIWELYKIYKKEE